MTTPTRIKTFLIVSAILMIVGHWAVMHSGAVFDPKSGEYYNLSTRWVSDFAAKWPEGLWIKGSIVLFCVALGEFIRLVILRFSDNRYAGLWKFWWLLLATALIGELLLVIWFDMIPTHYIYHPPGLLDRVLGHPGTLDPVTKTIIEWAKQA